LPTKKKPDTDNIGELKKFKIYHVYKSFRIIKIRKMKRVTQCVVIILLTCLISQVSGQVVNENAKKRISIGLGMFTDVMIKFPSGVKPRTINQGFTVFGTYNMPFGKSNFSFAIGLGLTAHNFYGNFLVDKTSDSTRLVKIPDTVSYKRSKITAAYLEIPIEFRFKSKSKINVGIGFKAGLLVGSSTKYVGTGDFEISNYKIKTNDKTKVKFWGVKDLEFFTYGPTFRIGYKWFNVNASYMLSSIFSKSKGPEIIPLSIGFILMPF
jgi:hypothetical protein